MPRSSAPPSPTPERSARRLRRLHAHARTSLLAGLSALLLCTSTAFAGGPLDAAEEYRLKAAFLFNFASFATWPGTAEDAKLALCVYGEDPFGAHLDALEGRQAGKRSVQVQRVHSVDALDGCEMVFVTRPMIGNLARVLDRIGQRAVLSVADSPGALDAGVMLNMDSSSGRISFAANLAAARRQGIALSARLLKLATEVRQ